MRGLCGKVYGTFLATAEGGGERRTIAYFWGRPCIRCTAGRGTERGVLLSQVSSSNWYAVFERFEIAPNLLNEGDRTLRPRNMTWNRLIRKSQVVEGEGKGLL